MIGCEVKYILLWTHGCSPPSFSNVFENSFPGLQFIFRLIRRRVSRVTEQANAKSRGICVCHSCCQHSVGGPRIRINILQRAGKKQSVSCSVVCDPLSSRLLCPWDSPGRNTGVGCHFLLQGIFWTQEWNPCSCISRRILYHEATLVQIFTLCFSIVKVHKIKFTINDISSIHHVMQSSPVFLEHFHYLAPRNHISIQ